MSTSTRCSLKLGPPGNGISSNDPGLLACFHGDLCEQVRHWMSSSLPLVPERGCSMPDNQRCQMKLKLQVSQTLMMFGTLDLMHVPSFKAPYTRCK